MTEFEASNGYKVQCTENDLFIKSPDDPIFVCVPDNANIKALREFFAQERCDELPFRHGEPKPWWDAQSGEVWSISDGYTGGLAICQREEQDDGDDHPYFYGPNFDGIRGDALTAGARLEVQS